MGTYDDVADWYDDLVTTNPLYGELIVPALLGLVPSFVGLTVCDVACGQGIVSRELARRGANVTGVDISPNLLAIAGRYESELPLGIRYVEDDAQSLTNLADSSFDGVTSSMALMNIPDLAATFAAIRRVLRPSGWLVCAILHPCFQPPESRWMDREDGRRSREVLGYFDERFYTVGRPGSPRELVGEEHRMLSTYINSLAAAGLAVDAMAEPKATGRRAAQEPGNLEAPSILIIRARVIDFRLGTP